MDLLRRVSQSPALTVISLSLAAAGALLVSRSGTNATASDLDSAAAAHAAAGIVTGDTAVTEAFNARALELQALLHVTPNDVASTLELARLYDDGHRPALAVPLYQRAIALDPDAAQPYYDLASLHALASDWAEARSVLEDRLQVAPTDGVAMYDLGAVEANAGNASDALSMWKRAREATADATLKGQIDAAIGQLAAVPAPDPVPPR